MLEGEPYKNSDGVTDAVRVCVVLLECVGLMEAPVDKDAVGVVDIVALKETDEEFDPEFVGVIEIEPEREIDTDGLGEVEGDTEEDTFATGIQEAVDVEEFEAGGEGIIVTEEFDTIGAIDGVEVVELLGREGVVEFVKGADGDNGGTAEGVVAIVFVAVSEGVGVLEPEGVLVGVGVEEFDGVGIGVTDGDCSSESKQMGEYKL